MNSSLRTSLGKWAQFRLILLGLLWNHRLRNWWTREPTQYVVDTTKVLFSMELSLKLESSVFFLSSSFLLVISYSLKLKSLTNNEIGQSISLVFLIELLWKGPLLGLRLHDFKTTQDMVYTCGKSLNFLICIGFHSSVFNINTPTPILFRKALPRSHWGSDSFNLSHFRVLSFPSLSSSLPLSLYVSFPSFILLFIYQSSLYSSTQLSSIQLSFYLLLPSSHPLCFLCMIFFFLR